MFGRRLRYVDDRYPTALACNSRRIEHALAFALRFDGGKRVHHGDEFMAKITAERLVKHLERSGFVVMKKPPLGAPTTHPGRKPTT